MLCVIDWGPVRGSGVTEAEFQRTLPDWEHLAGRVGEDGLPADADEAGPIYGAGGFELDHLSQGEDEAATRRARGIFSVIADRRAVR